LCQKKNKGKRNGGATNTHTLSQNARDLLAHAALPPANLLADGGEAAALAELHDELDLAVGRRHVRAVEADDVRVPEAREERELARELLQRPLVRHDRLARVAPPRARVLHRLHSAAGALAEQRDDLQHAVRPCATARVRACACTCTSAARTCARRIAIPLPVLTPTFTPAPARTPAGISVSVAVSRGHVIAVIAVVVFVIFAVVVVVPRR